MSFNILCLNLNCAVKRSKELLHSWRSQQRFAKCRCSVAILGMRFADFFAPLSLKRMAFQYERGRVVAKMVVPGGVLGMRNRRPPGIGRGKQIASTTLAAAAINIGWRRYLAFQRASILHFAPTARWPGPPRSDLIETRRRGRIFPSTLSVHLCPFRAAI